MILNKLGKSLNCSKKYMNSNMKLISFKDKVKSNDKDNVVSLKEIQLISKNKIHKL